MSISIAIATAATALLGTQALAAEPFNGPYIGAEIGWQQDRLRGTATSGGVDLDLAENKSSFAYGGVLGYDLKVGSSFVLGAEVGASGDSGKIRFNGLEADAGRTFGIAGRAGILATPKTLVYGRGGWVNGRFSIDNGTDKVSSNRDGWTIGAGIEQMLSENISAKVEYRYSKFNRFRADAADLGGDEASARFRRNQLLAGVNFRF